MALDHRVVAVRRDLADIRMADRVFAPHYSVPVRRGVGRIVPLRRTPAGEPLSQLLPGEPFDVLEFTSTHAWGRSPIDGAVGFVERGVLVDEYIVTHIVASRRAALHAGPATSRPLGIALPMGARVAATANGDWMEVDGGYVHADTLRAFDSLPHDPVAVALALKDVPVVAGGRSGDGVDAAGLVFLTLAMAGAAPARFGDLQATSIGTPLAPGDPARRGDLIFFADHVAMLVDADIAIHADATVRCEPLAALDRFGPVLARRRPA